MPPSEDPHMKVRQRYLYGAYGVAGVGFIFAVWRGWFTASSSFTTEVAPGVILALAFATALVRGPFSSRLTPARPARNVIVHLGKGLLCWAGAFVWIVLTARRVPDTYVGAAVLFIPTLGLGLWGATYFYRASRVVTDATLRTLLIPHAAEEGIADRPSPDTLGAIGANDRVEIAVDYGTVLLKFVASLLLYAAAWWGLGRDNALITILFAAGTAFLVYINARIVFGHGPGLVMDSSGISIRSGLGLVTALPWAQATTVELKTTKLFSCLVVGVRNSESLFENATGYRRWAMRSNEQRFGSPVVLFASSLKCDRTWVVQTVAAYRARYGATE
jgi:hypothetical protein